MRTWYHDITMDDRDGKDYTGILSRSAWMHDKSFAALILASDRSIDTVDRLI